LRNAAPVARPGEATIAGGPISAQLLEWLAVRPLCDTTRRMTMKNPLDSLWGTIISGLILTAILYAAVKNLLM
jgi:hypothetical protein